MYDIRGRLLGDVRPGDSFGLEIGPLHFPMVRRDEGRILYVDHAPAEILRADFRHPGADPADIVEVDIVWGGPSGGRSLREAVGEPADYVLARHVAEHVPDLIGWLLEIRDALRPDGCLGLEVPDRRYTFDVWRRESGPGEVVEAYLRGHRQPSLRQVFDAAALSRDTGEERPAGGSLPAETQRRLPLAFEMVRALAAAPRYVDVHCWVFTPESFVDLAQALARIDCFPYDIEGFFPTEAGNYDFQVRLRAAEPGAPAIERGITRARQVLAASPPADAMPALAQRIAALEREKDELQASLRTLRQSTSWRLTAPLRWSGRRLRR